MFSKFNTAGNNKPDKIKAAAKPPNIKYKPMYLLSIVNLFVSVGVKLYNVFDNYYTEKL